MNSRKTTVLSGVPRSGDALADWVFKQFVFFLRKGTVRIKRKRYLFDKKDPNRQPLFGLMREDVDGYGIDITLSAAKTKHCNRNEEVVTLIHELSHVVFWKTEERFIGQVERILVAKLTTEQKNYLKAFIPRHTVKSA